MIPYVHRLQIPTLMSLVNLTAISLRAVNVDGVYNTVQAWTQDLVAGGSNSAVVIIGSTEGFKGASALNTYCRSKAAVSGFARSAALEFGPFGVRVNTISPGTIRTPCTSQRRWARKLSHWTQSCNAKRLFVVSVSRRKSPRWLAFALVRCELHCRRGISGGRRVDCLIWGGKASQR
ncbi:hypothetical protein BDW75DRAFT_223403 [Aspergillus navahoensis]